MKRKLIKLDEIEITGYNDKRFTDYFFRIAAGIYYNFTFDKLTFSPVFSIQLNINNLKNLDFHNNVSSLLNITGGINIKYNFK